jgi:hypothetical protein
VVVRIGVYGSRCAFLWDVSLKVADE